jgi:uncharacterized protein (TIGR02145 family)
MQDMTSFICGDMDIYSTLTLKDTRNNQDYRVRKMPDGHCWMIDNLKLELYTGMQLTSADSNVPAGAPTVVTLAAGGLSGNFTVSGRMTADNTTSNGTNYDNYNAWRQANPSDPSMPKTETCVMGMFIDSASETGCGYLYNWYTATAGYGDNNKTSGFVESSICPARWHLPRGGDDTLDKNELAILNSAMYDGSLAGLGSTTDTEIVMNWMYTGLFAGNFSGVFVSDGFDGQGVFFDFWSSSAGSANNARDLGGVYNEMIPGTRELIRLNGFAVRCLI